jgi:hypothetical protein
MARTPISDRTDTPPFETEDLRSNVTRFLDTWFDNTRIGNYKWAVYAFFDYDGEPIYVGQTNKMVRTRIRQHLTSQRSGAVAVSVLDPFEVYEIEVWPLTAPGFLGAKQRKDTKREAQKVLDALERAIYDKLVADSRFNAILNEKDPPKPSVIVSIPASFRQTIVSEEVHAIRAHPDTRIARRALIMARLAQAISERKVQGGLRRVLLVQAQRLQWLAQRRYDALGAEASVEVEGEEDRSDDEG